jgi:WD40 repeat protein
VKQDLDTNFVEDASNSNWILGLDCAISADGSRIAVTGGINSIKIYVWNYDSSSGTYVINVNNDRIYKSVAENDKSYMDMSADGNRIVHSENNKNVYVFDYDSETNKWGKFNSDGSFTNTGYYLSVTDVSYNYGRTCSISADGKTLIACGDLFNFTNSGG